MRPAFTAKQLRCARRDARKRGLPADLSWRQWQRTINDFAGVCAYCRDREAWTIDHYIPMARGGSGTSVDNCLPACGICNGAKGGSYPCQTTLPEEIQAQLEHYLQLRGQGKHTQATTYLRKKLEENGTESSSREDF